MSDRQPIRVVSSTASPSKRDKLSMWRDRDLWGGVILMLTVGGVWAWWVLSGQH